MCIFSNEWKTAQQCLVRNKTIMRQNVHQILLPALIRYGISFGERKCQIDNPPKSQKR